jgi:hypothetical protein
LIIVFIVTSCGQTAKESNATATCTEPQIKPTYYLTVCQGDSCSFVHYLMLSSYNDKCFNEYNFVYIADKYLDSVQTHLPVAAIQFTRPFKFNDIGGSENDEQLKKHAIMAMWYENQSITNKVPEISHISIWTNGERKTLDYLHVVNRKQGMDYYNSKKRK